ERRRYPVVPRVRPRLQTLDVVGALTAAQCPRTGVVQRAQKTGDVAHRVAFEPALRQRASGIALEVDDLEVVAGPQHLPQVVVAVRARANAVDAALGHASE